MAASEIKDKKNLLLPLFAAVVIVALLAAGYFFIQYQKAQTLLKNPSQAAVSEIKALTDKVGQLIELPVGEDPTVATVSDKTKLSDQVFFRNAQNGDKVLIYTKAKKAILYRPSTNKIIEVAPVNIGESNPTPAAAPSGSPTQAQTYKTILWNGTTTVGLTNKVEIDLKAKLPEIIVADKDNASRNNYTKTIVVDLTGKNSSEAQKLAVAVGGEVGTLPTGEKKPSGADFLVILSK